MDECYSQIAEEFLAQRKALKETNDCTVIAYAIAFDTTYQRAHKHLQDCCGRKNRKGINSRKVLTPSLTHTKFKIGPYSRQNRITVGQFIKKHPQGRYYVCVRSHAFAIIDGVVHDHWFKPRRQITWAVRIHL